MWMIEGFKLTVSGKELKTHFLERAKHHHGRAAWYAQQRGQFADAPTAQMSNDPVQGLKDAGKRHEQREAVFAFYAEHVEQDQQYRLSDHELQQLELIQSSHGY